MKIKLPEAILSFPHLGKPVKNNLDPSQAPRYKCDLIFPKGTDLTKLKEAIEEVRIDKLGKEKHPKNPPIKECSSQLDNDTGMVRALHDQGDFYISPWTAEGYPPALISPDAKPDYFPGHFKGGNIVQAIVDVWGSPFAANPSIGFSLKGVQWRSEGHQIGGAPVSASEFDVVPPVDMADLGI